MAKEKKPTSAAQRIDLQPIEIGSDSQDKLFSEKPVAKKSAKAEKGN